MGIAMKILSCLFLLLTAPWGLSQIAAGHSALHGRLTFDTWVTWSEVPLPAGRYTLAVEFTSTTAEFTLGSAQGKSWGFSPVGILAGAESGRSEVCLNLRQDRRHQARWEVRSVNLPEFGLSFLFAPRNTQQDRRSPRSNCVPITMDASNGA
jgi:hypothetical protein